MGLNTLTDVDQIQNVQNSQGDRVAPATENQQQRVAAAAENADKVVSDNVTVDTAGETLPSYSVAPGKEVLLLADPANSGPVYVGPLDNATMPLTKGSGVSLQVTDTGLLDARASNTGDVLHLLLEAE